MTEAGRFGDVLAATVDLLTRNAGLLHDFKPRMRFNRCGYILHDVLGPDTIDLCRLLVGSEGTLALFTEATLKTVPLPAARSAILFGFPGMESALRAAQQVLPSEPSACELIDHRLLTLARGRDAGVAALIAPGVEAVLLIEFESDSSAGARALVMEAMEQVHKAGAPPYYVFPALHPEEVDKIRRLRELAAPSVLGLRGGARPVPVIEDGAVPIHELSTYLRRTQDILQRHQTTACFLVYAGTGQVHVRPFLDLNRSEDATKLWAIADEVHSLALDLGGTVSAQQGTGLARTPWVARQYGPLFPVLRELKAIFDPHQLFNPGKIISVDSALKPEWPLRRALVDAPALTSPADLPAGNGASAVEAPLEPASVLRWHPAELRQEVSDCNGCGDCRTEASNRRMCPIFRASQAEAATPRAKANLMRHLLQEGTDSRLLSSDQVREVADLCVNCKMCAIECPAHVNIPKLMLEAKAANTAEHGLSRSDWVLARTESFASFGSAFAVFVNGAFSSRTIRWLMEKLFGVSRRTTAADLCFPQFLEPRRAAGLDQPPRSRRPRVAYFVDVFANYNDPQIAEAVVAVLHHHGIEVFVPPDQIGCGMAPLAQGDAEGSSRSRSEKPARLCGPCPAGVRDPVLGAYGCTDAASRLSRSGRRPGRGAGRRADHGADGLPVGAYIEQGRLRTDFQRLDFTVGHHVPCHLKALGLAAGRPRAAFVDPRPSGAYNRRELLGHGGDVRPEGGELCVVAESRGKNAGRADAAGRRVWLDRVQHVPASDGGRERKADAASGAVSCPGVRPHASDRRPASPTNRRARLVMNVHVRLFARARELAGRDSLDLDLAARCDGGRS